MISTGAWICSFNMYIGMCQKLNEQSQALVVISGWHSCDLDFFISRQVFILHAVLSAV